MAIPDDLTDIPNSLLNEIHIEYIGSSTGRVVFQKTRKTSTTTVGYSLSYILAEGKRNQTNCLIWDVRKRSDLSGGLQFDYRPSDTPVARAV